MDKYMQVAILQQHSCNVYGFGVCLEDTTMVRTLNILLRKWKHKMEEQNEYEKI